MLVNYYRNFIPKQLRLIFLLFAVCISENFSQDAPNIVSKKAGIAFRIDDNQDINKYLEYASIFNNYNKKFTFALNLGLSTITPTYIQGVKQLQASGHEMMDHTPTHRTNYFYTNLNTTYYESHPGVHKISDNKIELNHAPVDIYKAKRTGYVNINGNIVTSSSGIFADFSKYDCYLYFPALDKLVFIDDVTGWKDQNTVEVKTFWRNEIDLGYHENIQFYNFDNANIHLTVDALRALIEESVRLADYYNITRPKVWIQPGGYFPRVYRNEIKAASEPIGYKSAGIFTDYGLKVFNEFNPDDEKQFGMTYGDFQEESWTLEQIKTFIADKIAKHQVVFNESHFQSQLGGWSGFLDRTEKLIQWCVEKDIPIRTYTEWSNILYRQIPDPNENIIPPLNIDLDENGFPDGYKRSNVEGTLIKTDGYPTSSDYCFSINHLGLISSITNLGGIEKGENAFEIWTKGASGNFIEVTFKVNNQNFVYKFPAESSNWTKYTLQESINGNTSLFIPENVSQIDVSIVCSNYSSGDVRISGMRLSKSYGNNEYLGVSPTSRQVSSASGNSNFSVVSNLDWVVSSNSPWLSVSPSNGSNNGIITAAFTENNDITQRIGSISISGGGISRTVTVTQAPFEISLSITPSNSSVSNQSGTTTFEIISNTVWTVEDNASWLTLSTNSGFGNATITASYSNNPNATQRSATITVTGGNKSCSATLTQESTPTVTVEPANQEVAYTSGTTSFKIKTNRSWTASDDAAWMLISPTSGPNDETINVVFQANPSTNQRVGTITVISGGITVQVTVTQEAKPFQLDVLPSDVNVTFVGDTIEISVSSNTTWSATENSSWLTLLQSSGSGDGTVRVAVAENLNLIDRNGIITISGGGITRSVMINQESMPFLVLQPEEKFVGYSSGSTTFSIDGNRNWVATDDADWISVSPNTGEGTGTLTVNYADNLNITERVATITVEGGGLSKTITLTQKSTPILLLNPDELFVENKEGSSTFSINSNRNWQIEENVEWLTVTPMSGTNDATINISFAENTDVIRRVGIITVHCAETSTSIKVTQNSSPFLQVQPSDNTVANEQGSINFAISTNRHWNIEYDTEWLYVTPTSGNGDSVITVVYTDNIDTVDRVGTIKISSEDITKFVTLKQSSAPFLDVLPKDFFVGKNDSSITVKISSNRDWRASVDSDWLTLKDTLGFGCVMLEIFYMENHQVFDRVGKVIIQGAGYEKIISITQMSAPMLEIIPTEYLLSNDEGSEMLTITSNRRWVLETDVNWLTFDFSNGENTKTVTMVYTANPDTIERSGTITVTSEDATRSAIIKQASHDFLSVSTSTETLPADSGYAFICIQSNTNWEIVENVSWLDLDKYNGTLVDTVSIHYAVNKKSKPRLGSILVSGGGISRELILNQNGAGAFLIVKTDMNQLDPDSGKISVDVLSNTYWKIQSGDKWIYADPDSGMENESITIFYSNNQDSLSRIGSVLFYSDSVSTILVLEQAGLEVFEILAESDSSISGVILGSGRYLFGSQVKLIAIPNKGWKFKHWIENGSIVSTDSIYTFYVTDSRTLIADFEKILTGIWDDTKLADKFELYQNYPNPFNPETRIKYAVPSEVNGKPAHVTLKIFDVLGNEVVTLVDEEKSPQYYEVIWLTNGVPSGVYIYQLRVGDFISSKKMVLLK
ncbi:MAG: T9SS type A sorting domain-containing protein [Ignavibacteriaceae bacterium]|nr:T9SS type A sorting domain-containing protein [Ignavibacteriaceae bacterium]